MSELYNIKQLCEYFDISETTAYTLVHRRDFPSVKIGGKFRIIVDKLPEWLEKKSKTEKK
jgi:excisionase family DNA binding protein